MSEVEAFQKECAQQILRQGQSDEAAKLTRQWMDAPVLHHYSYHFSWLGRPVIQYPQDIVAMQELVFAVKPDLIIETGIAHGGSLLMYASYLELNALCGGPQKASVLGIDIDIRSHNMSAIKEHPLFGRGRISLLQGSSISSEIISKVKTFADSCTRIMVVLDSNHTHEHVLAELEAYAPLVSVDSYCVVFDTVVEYKADGTYPDRPWGKGNSPMSAVKAWLPMHSEFEIDLTMDAKLLISVAPNGYLKRVKS